MSQWHGVFSLISGITKHDSLITGTNAHLRPANLHASCTVRGLLVDAHRDLASLVAETPGIVGAEVNHIGSLPMPWTALRTNVSYSILTMFFLVAVPPATLL